MPVRLPIDPLDNPDNELVSAADRNQRTELELLTSIDNKLGALIMLLSNAYGVRDDPVSLILAADQSLRSVS